MASKPGGSGKTVVDESSARTAISEEGSRRRDRLTTTATINRAARRGLFSPGTATLNVAVMDTGSDAEHPWDGGVPEAVWLICEVSAQLRRLPTGRTTSGSLARAGLVDHLGRVGKNLVLWTR